VMTATTAQEVAREMMQRASQEVLAMEDEEATRAVAAFTLVPASSRCKIPAWHLIPASLAQEAREERLPAERRSQAEPAAEEVAAVMEEMADTVATADSPAF
jgi:hypothetical protein